MNINKHKWWLKLIAEIIIAILAFYGAKCLIQNIININISKTYNIITPSSPQQPAPQPQKPYYPGFNPPILNKVK